MVQHQDQVCRCSTLPQDTKSLVCTDVVFNTHSWKPSYVLQPCLKTGNRIWIAEMVCRPFFVFMATSKYKSARGRREGSIRRRREDVEVRERALNWWSLAKTSSSLWTEPQKKQIQGCPPCPAQEESTSMETRQTSWGKSSVVDLVWQVGNDPL